MLLLVKNRPDTTETNRSHAHQRYLPRVWINGGRRGFLVGLSPQEIVRVLAPTLVDVAVDA